MVNQDTLKTIWEVPDDLWEEIEQLIAELDPPKDTDRKRADPLSNNIKGGDKMDHVGGSTA